MGAILTKHIQTAEIVIIEDETPNSRIGAPILTISQEDKQKFPIITSN